MTNAEIYNTIFSYWLDLCKVKPETMDRAIWRIDTCNSIYDALVAYNQLCIRERKEVRL